MRFLVLLASGLVFCLLFAFALNNQQLVVVNWLFGASWHAPMVMIVLAAFTAGCAVGVLAMVPDWWRQRRIARRHAPTAGPPPPPPPSTMVPSEFGPEHPPRDGL